MPIWRACVKLSACSLMGSSLFTCYKTDVETKSVSLILLSGEMYKLPFVVGDIKETGQGHLVLAEDRGYRGAVVTKHGEIIHEFVAINCKFRLLSGVATSGANLYFVTNRHGELYIMTEAGNLIQNAVTNQYEVVSITIHQNKIWLSSSENRISVFDMNNNNLTEKHWSFTIVVYEEDLARPVSLAFYNGTLVFLNEDSSICFFNPTSGYVISCPVGRRGSGDGQMNNPADLVIDKGGRIYVCDTDTHRILLFTSEGKFLKIVQSWTDGSHRNPTALFLKDNHLYVSLSQKSSKKNSGRFSHLHVLDIP